MCGFLCLPVAVSCDVQCVVGALDESINVSSRPLAFCFHLRRQEKDSKLYVCCQIPTLVLLGMRETVPRVGTADKVTGRFSAQDGQVSVVVGFGPREGILEGSRRPEHGNHCTHSFSLTLLPHSSALLNCRLHSES